MDLTLEQTSLGQKIEAVEGIVPARRSLVGFWDVGHPDLAIDLLRAFVAVVDKRQRR
jgi:hypothetical protein